MDIEDLRKKDLRDLRMLYYVEGMYSATDKKIIKQVLKEKDCEYQIEHAGYYVDPDVANRTRLLKIYKKFGNQTLLVDVKHQKAVVQEDAVVWEDLEEADELLG